MIQDCVGKVEISKRNDSARTSIGCGSEYDIVLIPNIYVLSDITHGG